MPDQFGNSDADLERGDYEYMRAKEDGNLPPSRRSRVPKGECTYCDQLRANGVDFAPPHDASRNCASGGRKHCSCDTCF